MQIIPFLLLFVVVMHCVTGQFREVKRLYASDAIGGDAFGDAAGVSGDIAVVGSARKNSNGSNSGTAYVYQRDYPAVDAWGQVAQLFASDAASSHFFGDVVAIDGDLIVVGAYGVSWNATFSGSAYIFSRNFPTAGAWGEIAQLFPSVFGANHLFGRSVAISGQVVVVGAPRADQNGSRAGAAYIFDRNVTASPGWVETSLLFAPDAAPNAYFGRSVAASGDTVIVGADGNAYNGTNTGSVYVFARSNSSRDAWDFVAQLFAPDAAAADRFGMSIGIDGDLIVCGAAYDSDVVSSSGSVYVYERAAAGNLTWLFAQKLTASTPTLNENLGVPVAIHGGTIVAAALGTSDNASYAGSAYVFERVAANNASWVQVAQLYPSDPQDSGYFSESVAVCRSTIVVGASGVNHNGTESGNAYIYCKECAQVTSSTTGEDSAGSVLISQIASFF